MNLVVLATAWGPKHGGINSFNLDFSIALAAELGDHDCLICVVLEASSADHADAKANGVILIDLEKDPNCKRYDSSWAHTINEIAKRDHGIDNLHYWVGHDVVSGRAAVKGAEITSGTSALIMHMSYGAYQPFSGGTGEEAKIKDEEQREVFDSADILFANGPLLNKALEDITGRSTCELVPGFANVKSRSPQHHFAALTFGRMDAESARIKQGTLAAAGFGCAVKTTEERPDASGPLAGDVRMYIAGISEPGGADERNFEQLIEGRTKRGLNITISKFEEDRKKHFDLIGRSSVAMMLSWHEGFGLTGWEAIAAKVPLIVGKNTGLYMLLENTLGADMAPAYVKVIDVKGVSASADEPNSFRPEDEKAVSDAILQVASNLEFAQSKAGELKDILTEKLGCSWNNTARTFLNHLDVVTGPDDGENAPPDVPTTTPSSCRGLTTENYLIAVPGNSWPEEKMIRVPDSLLLRPENRVVRFHSFRQDLKAEIVEWVLAEPDLPVRMRLHAGEGGAGKTRMMIEVCLECAEVHDWRTGFMPSGQDITAELPKLLAAEHPTVIVLDYAETRTLEIAQLVETALAFPGQVRLRLLLLSRDGRDWWNRLADNSPNNRAAAAIMRDASTKQGPYYLVKHELGTDERATAFVEARQDFARQKGEAYSLIDLPDLSAKHFGQPIYVHMAALQSLRGDVELGQDDLLEATLSHEREYWKLLLTASDLTGKHSAQHLELAVAAITLVGGCPTAAGARELIDRTPRVCDATPAEKTEIFDILSSLYRSNVALVPLQPDVLGEMLVDQALTLDDGLLETVFGRNASKQEAEAAMTVLARMARRNASAAHWLEHVLATFLPERIPETIAVAQETGGPIAALMGAAIGKFDGSKKRLLIKKYGEYLPESSDNLSEFTISLHESQLKLFKGQKGKRTFKQNRAVIQVCTSLARSLHENGKHAEAVLPARQAWRLTKSIFKSDNPSDRSMRASIVGALAHYLYKIGEHAEGVMNARQAEELMRDLAGSEPEAYTADWATSLSNLASFLSDVGEFDEALQKARQSEELRRNLAGSEPEAYTADWATSLSNLASFLSDVGEFDEALQKARQAEELRRNLAGSEPDAHTADWAASLSNLGNILSAVGEFDEALQKARQAEELRRDLARSQPDAHTADWAASLSNLGSTLSAVGEFEEALQNARQAEELRRDLARSQPDAHTAVWAMSLSNLGSILSDVGEFEEALQKARQAEELRRDLARSQPDAHTAVWAMSLGNIADLLVRRSRFFDANEVEDLSISALEKFESNSNEVLNGNRKWRAFVLRSLSEALLSKGKLEDGREVAYKSLALWSEVNLQTPGVEFIHTINSTMTVIRCEVSNHNPDRALNVLDNWVSENARFAKLGGAPSKLAIRELADMVITELGPEAIERFSTDLRELGELGVLRG